MKTLAGCLLTIAATMQTSCSERKNHEPLVSVRGTVFYQQLPAAGARVSFVPIIGSSSLRPQGSVGTDGSFELSTYELNDGAPAGRYAVAITWPGPNPRSNGAGDDEIQGPDRLNGRYSDPSASVWQVEVGSTPLQLEPFQLE